MTAAIERKDRRRLAVIVLAVLLLKIGLPWC